MKYNLCAFTEANYVKHFILASLHAIQMYFCLLPFMKSFVTGRNEDLDYILFIFVSNVTAVQCYTKSNCNKVICMMKEDLLRARSLDIARMVYCKTLESLTRDYCTMDIYH